MLFHYIQVFAYSVEWQKRGLLHAHILLRLANEVQPDSIDKIPDEQQEPIHHKKVIKNMIHGPCESLISR